MKRVRIGVVGCGAIAQVHHLPNLTALPDQFEVAGVCDVSPSAAADAARRFRVPRHVTDYRDLLAADLDAVLLCHTDPKTEAAVAALEAGKHLFIEKPVCFSLPEIDAMIAAQRAAGTVAQDIHNNCVVTVHWRDGSFLHWVSRHWVAVGSRTLLGLHLRRREQTGGGDI